MNHARNEGFHGAQDLRSIVRQHVVKRPLMISGLVTPVTGYERVVRSDDGYDPLGRLDMISFANYGPVLD